jgi:hypothetical protein
MFRFLSVLFILLSLFILPNFITAFLLFIFIFIFDSPFEVLFFAYILDILYHGGVFFGYESLYLFTIIFLFIFIISFKLKTVLKFYERK